ncbi:hypothetical protein [Burkholderia ubonensis]|uniref:hypothetical protein n=1 Tax=Burkholderia ubonensis TaxID=101571 RepID=UPI001E57895E|nr:hypothetical protein [Burkholderia ubonensis]
MPRPASTRDVLDLQAAQLVRAETAPEAEQHQRAVTEVSEPVPRIACVRRMLDLHIKPCRQFLELHELQRPRTLFGRGMQRRDALEHLAHVRRLGRVRETLRLVPLRERGEPRSKRVDRQGLRVFGEVERDRVGARRQETAPFDLEMTERGLIAAPRVFARGGFGVSVNGVGRHGIAVTIRIGS